MKKIFVVGSLNTDLVINAPYMPLGGETIRGNGFMTNCGGKGANQAYACGKLGGNAYMCGCVGDDDLGKMAVANLKSVGVNTDFIYEIEKTPTGVAVIVVTEGENRIIIDSGANGFLSKKHIDSALSIAEAGDIYLTQLENPIDVIGYGLELARKKGLVTVLNPAPASLDIVKYLECVDIITPNETELAILGGKDVLFDKGVKTVITTLGGSGYEIATKESAVAYPCIKVDVLDTTAAGDTASGGLCLGLSQGWSIEKSMELGSICASLACSKRGAQQSVPTMEEAMKYFKK